MHPFLGLFKILKGLPRRLITRGSLRFGPLGMTSRRVNSRTGYTDCSLNPKEINFPFIFEMDLAGFSFSAYKLRRHRHFSLVNALSGLAFVLGVSYAPQRFCISFYPLQAISFQTSCGSFPPYPNP